MILRLDVICGVCFGAEFATKEEMGEFGDGWYFVVDLFIIRIILEKE